MRFQDIHFATKNSDYVPGKYVDRILLDDEKKQHRDNLSKVRRAHGITIRNQKIHIFEMARKFINKQVDSIMKKAREEFDFITNQ